MELDWTKLPPAREEAAQARENQAARKGLPSPRRCSTWARPARPRRGPSPASAPPGPFPQSPVIMPRKAEAHIQNTAPGPPKKMAVATRRWSRCAMVEARAVDRAWARVRPRPFPFRPPSSPDRAPPIQRLAPKI